MRGVARSRLAARSFWVLMPALAAGALVAATVRTSAGVPLPPVAPAALPAGSELIPLAARRPAPGMRKLVARPGHAGLRVDPLERIAGGIRPSPPARLTVTAAGIDAAVVPVGVREDELEVPPVNRVGWFAAGPRPGDAGRAVLLGHVESADGPAVFWRLESLRPGAGIAVTDGIGEVQRFTVTAVESAAKSEFPHERVYGATSATALALITCGGPLVAGIGRRDNVIVFARAAR